MEKEFVLSEISPALIIWQILTIIFIVVVVYFLIKLYIGIIRLYKKIDTYIDFRMKSGD